MPAVSPPLVSVVTPIYNTAPYLRTCIESVLAQEYENFEYILLDNCSDDGSSLIAEEYSHRDPRIRLHRNPHLLNQVANYNAALRLCSPDARYVKIVQADDWLFPHCLIEMVRVGEDHPTCALIAAHYHLTTSLGASALPPSQNAFSGHYIARRQLLNKEFYFGSPTTIMFRADVVRARPAFYREGRYHGDTDLCYELARDYNIGFVHQILSGVRTDNPSIKTRTAKYSPYILDRLIQVETYGADFLSPSEFAALRKETRRDYYNALAPRIVRRSEPGFWDYHRRGLDTIGLKLNRVALAAAVIKYLLDLFLNPKRTLEEVWWKARSS
jgi:glycosyltransferase involved in cell wall biosynthesis